MTTASFRVTMAWDKKRPGKWSKLVNVGTRNEAVLCAQQWVVWSHAKDRPKKLHRYERYTVEEWDGAQWTMVREGTVKDATAEYREENTAPASVGTVQSISFAGRKAGFASRVRQAPRRNTGSTRLTNLVTKVLNDI